MKFNLSLTKDQLAIVNAALMEAPYRIAAPLIQEINKQIQHQFNTAKSNELTDEDKLKGDD